MSGRSGRAYYVEFGGGLGDVFQQIYERRQYASLADLPEGDRALVAVISHNPHVPELFAHHPRREQLDIRAPGYWCGEEDAARRREHGLPPYQGDSALFEVPASSGRPVFYPSEMDRCTLAMLWELAPRPLIVFALSAGLPERDIPATIGRQIFEAVVAAGYLPVFVGRDYERHGRAEHHQDWMAEGWDCVNALSVPGTAALVQRAAGVVCCHSAINMLAWMERKPQILLYPESVKERHFTQRDQWSVGADYPETVHGTFDAFAAQGATMIERFQEVLKGERACAP